MSNPDSTDTPVPAPTVPVAARTSATSVRVDVWLHSVRLYKTRSEATQACKGGHIKINEETAKPAQKVRVGDTLTFRKDARQRIIEVTGLIVKRVGSPVAVQQYKDHSPEPIPRSLLAVPYRERGSGRPTKKERRQLDLLRGYSSRTSGRR